MRGPQWRWALWLALVSIGLQTGCGGEVGRPTSTSVPLADTLQVGTVTLPPPSATPVPSLASGPTPEEEALTSLPPQTVVPATIAPSACSPLEGIDLANLEEVVVNPYHPPRSGSDDPHQGIDLAYRDPETGIALSGRPVYAALPGIVAGVIQDRFPYGNAILVETTLDSLPSGWESLLPQTGTPEVRTSLTCPEVDVPLSGGGGRSLYTLYAHFEEIPGLGPGEEVACGSLLGQTGSSGNALNPHVHIEMRVGPSGARFESMAHYDTSASNLEMATYCLWRVSGEFVLADPLKVLESVE